jgi:hypothetical protein
MLRLLRMAVLSAVAALGLPFGSTSTASAHDWWTPYPARVHVHRYGYLSGYGPSVYHPRSLYGRSLSLYVAPRVSVYAGPSVGFYGGPAPGFYPRPFAYGYNYYHGPYDYSHHYGW